MSEGDNSAETQGYNLLYFTDICAIIPIEIGKTIYIIEDFYHIMNIM